MSDMPERINAWLWNGKTDAGGWHANGQGTVETYIRHDAPELVVLVEALRWATAQISALMEESGRGIDYGEEDAFRMGEWFDAEDTQRLIDARAALAAWEKINDR